LGKRSTDPVKAAKKEIRKGKNKPGFATVRAQVQDQFGYKHGYQSDAAKKLDSSRLVQRKYAQEARQMVKNQPSAKRGAAKDWEGTPKFGEFGDASQTFTRKEGRQINRSTQKELRKETKDRTKLRKAQAKVTRLELKSKESPYKMYGKTSSPLEGGSPLAKYGCSKKHKK
jgi:hypothetical protein